MPRRKGRHLQTARTLRLLALLRERPAGVRLGELKAALRVSHSQLVRDLRALDAGGQRVKIEAEDEAPHYRFAKLGEQEVSAATSTRRERYSLLGVQAMCDVFAGTALREDVGHVFAKVTQRLSDDERRDLRRLAQRIVYVPDGGTKPMDGAGEILDEFLTGVMQGRLVEAGRIGQDARARWAPLGLALYRHGFYVVASKLSDPRATSASAEALGHPRVYALERFVEPKALRSTHIERPEDFDVRRFFDGAFGIFSGGKPKTVVLHFAAQVARQVAGRRMHESQVASPLPGGGLRLELTIRNLLEVKAWVLGWGPLVEVIEPARLRELVAQDVRRAARLYADVAAE